MNKKNKLILIMSAVLLCTVWAITRLFAPENEASDMRKSSENKEEDIREDSEAAPQKVIVLDAGHGGMDPGKVGVDGQLEKDINLAIVFKLKELLENDEEKRFKVVLTRTDDNGLYSEADSNKKMADMKKRCDIINNSEAAMLVSIHQNSYHSSSVKGAQVFYYESSEKGKILANSIQNSLVAKLAENEKGRVEKSNDNYYLLLNVKCPAVIVECGFLSNPNEAAALSGDEYQQRIAEAIVEGIADYIEKASE